MRRGMGFCITARLMFLWWRAIMGILRTKVRRGGDCLLRDLPERRGPLDLRDYRDCRGPRARRELRVLRGRRGRLGLRDRRWRTIRGTTLRLRTMGCMMR